MDLVSGDIYDLIYLQIKYESNTEGLKKRVVQIRTPKNTNPPYPLLVGVHYPVEFEDPAIKTLMNKNIAIMSVEDVSSLHLNNILEDNLSFHIAMVKVAKSLPYIDESKIMLRGGSAGGLILLLLLNQFKDEINSAFCLHGICNFAYQLKYLEKSNNRNQIGVRAVYENFKETLEYFKGPNKNAKLEKFSAICFKEFYKGPLLMMHSSSDAIVPINQWIDWNNEKEYISKMENFELEDKFNISWVDKYREITETFILDNLEKPVLKVPFSAKKPYSLVILDEKEIASASMHFKNFEYNKADESDFFLHYLSKKKNTVHKKEKLKIIRLEQGYGKSRYPFYEVTLA